MNKIPSVERKAIKWLFLLPILLLALPLARFLRPVPKVVSGIAHVRTLEEGEKNLLKSLVLLLDRQPRTQLNIDGLVMLPDGIHYNVRFGVVYDSPTEKLTFWIGDTEGRTSRVATERTTVYRDVTAEAIRSVAADDGRIGDLTRHGAVLESDTKE